MESGEWRSFASHLTRNSFYFLHWIGQFSSSRNEANEYKIYQICVCGLIVFSSIKPISIAKWKILSHTKTKLKIVREKKIRQRKLRKNVSISQLVYTWACFWCVVLISNCLNYRNKRLSNREQREKHIENRIWMQWILVFGAQVLKFFSACV